MKRKASKSASDPLKLWGNSAKGQCHRRKRVPERYSCMMIYSVVSDNHDH